MKRICLATNNHHKIQEIKSILKDTVEFISLAEIGCKEELPETQNTIPGNSLEKALYVAQKYNIYVLADDSGLIVHSLNGEPGVSSAMYGGLPRNEKNNKNLLLEKMKYITHRECYFLTVLTLIYHKKIFQFDGKIYGSIAFEERGSNGFGYDSLFIPKNHIQTFAEMSAEEKNKMSHRSIALHHFCNFLLHH
ncbi:MAG: RdgB/HAM1 family non-canonical purine NTP pyrophosphatase [Chitinophagaceae bacterium]|nr:RdgB/HAM1 family non-canonical purine NTP pyrophosphatase [Chitinophagaceae bacterium]